MLSKAIKWNHKIYLESLVCPEWEMGGGWLDQAMREVSGYSPSSLQVSWDVWNTWNSLLGINRGEGNTKNTIFYHLINQKCWESGQEKWITVQACQGILQ
jgi:hypothetical protein